METYTLLRHFADSWVLLALFAIFVGAVLWVWRPGSRRLHDDAGRIPFRHEDRPTPARHGSPDSTGDTPHGNDPRSFALSPETRR